MRVEEGFKYMLPSQDSSFQYMISFILLADSLDSDLDADLVFTDKALLSVADLHPILLSERSYHAVVDLVGFKDEKPKKYGDEPPFYLNLLSYIKYESETFTWSLFRAMLSQLISNSQGRASGPVFPGVPELKHILKEMYPLIAMLEESGEPFTFKVSYSKDPLVLSVSTARTGDLSSELLETETCVLNTLKELLYYVLSAEIAQLFPLHYPALTYSKYGEEASEDLQKLRNVACTKMAMPGDVGAWKIATVKCADLSSLHSISLFLTWQDAILLDDGRVELVSYPISEKTCEYLLKNYGKIVSQKQIEFKSYIPLNF
jgi:hypothetical protein